MFRFKSILQIWIILIGFRDTNDFVNLGICKHEVKFACRGYCRFTLTLSYPGGRAKYTPLLFFLHHPKTAQDIKLKLSDFKDTLSIHILQVQPVRYVLSCSNGNKITEGTSQDLATKKSEKSAICSDIELKFGIGTNFGPLSSKSNHKIPI